MTKKSYADPWVADVLPSASATIRLQLPQCSKKDMIMSIDVDEEATFQLRSGLYLLPQGDDEIFVRDGSRAAFSKVIRDNQNRRILSKLVQELTIPGTLSELADRLQTTIEHIEPIVERLVEGEVICPLSEKKECSVALIGEGSVGETLLKLLSDMEGISVTAGDAEELSTGQFDTVLSMSDLFIVATNVLRPVLNHTANEIAHELSIPLLYVFADGPEIQVGPMVYPGETACYTCFEVQDEGARHLRDEFLVFKDNLTRYPEDKSVSAPVAAMASAWAALAIEDAQAKTMSRFAERIVRVETNRFEVVSHRILQLPRCPSCSRYRPDLQHAFL